MPRFLAWFVALALGVLAPARSLALPGTARADSAAPASPFERAVEELRQECERARAERRPRAEVESLALLAALSMVRVLELEGRYQPLSEVRLEADTEAERWLHAGERVARVHREEFPAWFALERYQRQLGIWVGADDAELDRRLAGTAVPAELYRSTAALVERARRADRAADRSAGGTRAA